MRLSISRSRVAAVALLTVPMLAQEAAPVHASDGHSVQMIQNLTIHPTTNAPFTAEVVAEVSNLLPDGTTSSEKNRRVVARDSSGRIFQERRFFAPDGDVHATRLRINEYQDPARHERYECHPENKTCYIFPYFASAEAPAPKKPGHNPAVTEEDLGRRTIENVEALGSREVITAPPGAFGNKNPEPSVKEFWYSPQLQINLVVKRFDPRLGIQNFTVEKVSLTEPDPKLLTPPADYRMVKQDPQQARGY